ncbi:MAG: SapC family protein [Burkholderiaceae bacterium]|nr:SapC family protein [Burkholderiaceae bacterium]
MTILSLYEKPVVLDRNKHRNFSYKGASTGLKFAAKSVALPIAPVEFPAAAPEFPIVFAINKDGTGTPIGLFGVRENENLLIDADGKWLGFYIPGFIRRYPFVLNVEPDGQRTFVLFDEAYDGIGEYADCERLFNEDGSDTEFMKSMLNFMFEFSAQSEHAAQFVANLKKHDLLVPQQVVFTRAESESYTLDGFHIVDEKRLMALPDAALLELTRSGDLGRIYAHLLSLNNITRVAHRMTGPAPAKA